MTEPKDSTRRETKLETIWVSNLENSSFKLPTSRGENVGDFTCIFDFHAKRTSPAVVCHYQSEQGSASIIIEVEQAGFGFRGYNISLAYDGSRELREEIESKLKELINNAKWSIWKEWQ